VINAEESAEQLIEVELFEEIELPEEFIEFAPHSTWNPSMPLPNRRLTNAELNAWINLHWIDQIDIEIVRLTNIERVNHGLQPFIFDVGLSRAARFKSQEMSDLNYFSHDSPVYGSFIGIPRDLFGLQFSAIAENIAQGMGSAATNDLANATADRVVRAWMNSAGHRANILNANLTHIGVGFAENGGFAPKCSADPL